MTYQIKENVSGAYMTTHSDVDFILGIERARAVHAPTIHAMNRVTSIASRIRLRLNIA